MKSRPRESAVRCPLCRDGVSRARAIACSGCGAWYHGECWADSLADTGACAVFGCRTHRGVPPSPSEAVLGAVATLLVVRPRSVLGAIGDVATETALRRAGSAAERRDAGSYYLARLAYVPPVFLAYLAAFQAFGLPVVPVGVFALSLAVTWGPWVHGAVLSLAGSALDSVATRHQV